MVSTAAFRPDRRKGLSAGFGAYLLWGLFPLYFRETPPTSALEILFWRMVLTLAVVSAVLAARGGLGDLRRLWREPVLGRRVSCAAVFIATNWGVYIWAIANGHVVEAALGYYINPLVTVALGVAALHERLQVLQKCAVVLGAIAVVILTIDFGRPPLISLGLACSFAAYSFLKKQIDLPAVVSLAGETLVLAPIGIVGLAVMGVRGSLDFARHGSGHLLLILLAGVVTAVPLSLFATAARNLPLTVLGLLQYLTPTMVLLLGVFYFGESVSSVRWVGIAFVWSALTLLGIDASRPRRSLAHQAT
jgi:chloramphenicol-sensitive protein RarD